MPKVVEMHINVQTIEIKSSSFGYVYAKVKWDYVNENMFKKNIWFINHI